MRTKVIKQVKDRNPRHKLNKIRFRIEVNSDHSRSILAKIITKILTSRNYQILGRQFQININFNNKFSNKLEQCTASTKTIV